MASVLIAIDYIVFVIRKILILILHLRELYGEYTSRIYSHTQENIFLEAFYCFNELMNISCHAECHRLMEYFSLWCAPRSPGGRPVKPRRSGGKSLALPSDPASLIAEALRRKFAHHLHNTSSDKENSMESSPFGSPESPRVSSKRVCASSSPSSCFKWDKMTRYKLVNSFLLNVLTSHSSSTILAKVRSS